jgi:hypothetical protein
MGLHPIHQEPVFMFKPAAAVALLVALSAPAFAQSTAPGLWQIENKMGGNPELEKAMAQMQAQLAAMPPAQRKQMEAMMGKSGMSMASSGAMAVKVCITPEMATRQQLPSQTQGHCTSKIISRSASTLKMSFACTDPVSSGEATYTFTSDKAYTVKMAIQSMSQGKPQTVTMDGNAQWLAADCGSIKPITLPSQ